MLCRQSAFCAKFRSYKTAGRSRSVRNRRRQGTRRFWHWRRKVHRAGVSCGNLTLGRSTRWNSQGTFSRRDWGRESFYFPSTQRSLTRNFLQNRRRSNICRSWGGKHLGSCFKYNWPWRWKFCSCNIAPKLFSKYRSNWNTPKWKRIRRRWCNSAKRSMQL